MGLYDRVVSYIRTRHPGLLKLAENELENNPVVMFNNKARSLNIRKACILVCNDDYYRLFVSTGFSEDKLADSVSTSDFWDGTVPHSDWVTVNHDEASAYLQFFNSDDISSISKLHIKRFSASEIQYVFIAAETDDNQNIPSDSLETLVSAFSSFVIEKNG